MVEGPPGSTGGFFGGRRPVSPNRNSQTLVMNVDLSGGFDRDPGAHASLEPGIPADDTWGAGQALVSTHYHIGQVKRSLDATGRGLLNYYGNTHVPLYGGGLTLNGIARFGRTNLNVLQVNTEVSYEPSGVLGMIYPEPPLDAIPALEVGPSMGVIEQRWFDNSVTANYQHFWTPRQQSSFRVNAGRIRPADTTGPNTEWQNAMYSHSWATGSGFDLLGSYRFDRSRQSEQTIDSEPVRYQSATIGARVSKQLSPTRRVSVSFSGGGTQLLPVSGSSLEDDDLIHPSLSLAVDAVASGDWSMSLTANRQVTVLHGISATPLSNDDISLSLNGSVGRRLRLTVMGSYMRGTTLVSGTTATQGDTTAAGGNLSFRYGVKRWLGTFATYSYYRHRLDGALQSTAGLPPVYDRQSARAGVTLWLPLYGSF